MLDRSCVSRAQELPHGRGGCAVRRYPCHVTRGSRGRMGALVLYASGLFAAYGCSDDSRVETGGVAGIGGAGGNRAAGAAGGKGATGGTSGIASGGANAGGGIGTSTGATSTTSATSSGTGGSGGFGG